MNHDSTDGMKHIVLVHGWSMHSGMWGTFGTKLAKRYAVTYVDLPGHGKRAMIDRFDLETVAETLLDSTPRKAIWIGWSLGATLVMYLARYYPEHVTAVVSIAGNAKFSACEDWPTGMELSDLRRFAADLVEDSRGALLRFLSLQCQGLATPWKSVKELRERLDTENPPLIDALTGGLAILQNSDLRGVLANLHCPVLLLFGQNDMLVPVESGQAMQMLNPDARVHIVSGAAHMPFYTHCAETILAVDEFLSGASHERR